jgi:DNA polymerase-3 subunit alpha (Gram-positive type)
MQNFSYFIKSLEMTTGSDYGYVDLPGMNMTNRFFVAANGPVQIFNYHNVGANFKVFYPAAYYCCYLARNAESFDATRMTTRDVDALRGMIDDIKALDKSERTATKDDEVTILEILIEMNLRGIHIKPIDIYKSRAAEFFIDDDGEIVPPINSLPGIGQAAAEGFVAAREAGPFVSQDDMVRRKVSKSMVEQLKLAGCLNGIPETSQVTLFEFAV